MQCKACGAEITSKKEPCPDCGHKEKSKAPLLLLLLIPAALLVIALVIGVIVLILGIAGVSIFMVNKDANWDVVRPTDPSAYVEFMPETTEPTSKLSATSPYRQCFESYSDYVFPDSSTAYLAVKDVSILPLETLKIAREEIAARSGASFRDLHLQEYFDNRSWYTNTGASFTPNEVETLNLHILDIAILQREGRISSLNNPYLSQYPSTQSYVLADSNSRYLDGSDLYHLTEEELELVRYEILARYGYIFTDLEYLTFFCAKEWYEPKYSAAQFDPEMLNEFASDNNELIKVYEQIADGVSFSYTNPYSSVCPNPSSYVLSYSGNDVILESAIYELDEDEAIIACNEILARHGYVFTDAHLFEYFCSRTWYKPSYPPGDDSRIELTQLEKDNMKALNTHYEKLQNRPNIENLNINYDYTVESQIYSVTLPAYWLQYATIKQNGHNTSFYESSSMNSVYDGHIFSLELYRNPNECYARHQTLGTLTSSVGDCWYILVVYPTGEQCTPYAEELYERMEWDINNIINHISGANGYIFESN